MNTLKKRPKKNAEKYVEARMVLSTIGGLWFGREVWLPSENAPEASWVDEAHRKNLPGIISLYRERLAKESDGIEAVRRRAEFALTAIIAAAGLSATDFERLWASTAETALPIIFWFVGLAVEVFAVLVLAGVAVASKKLGRVDPWGYSAMKRSEREELRQYIVATHSTSRTRRGVVTVFRDAFIIALIGLLPLFTAHMVAWATPVPSVQSVVVDVVISSAPAHD